LRTCKDTSNLVQGPTYTFQNHTTIFLEDQSLMNCHNTTSSHNEPSLTTLSPCPNPPMTTTHRIFSKEGKDTKLGLIDTQPKAVGLWLTTNPQPQRTKSQTRYPP
jgi:hypothetical protein